MSLPSYLRRLAAVVVTVGAVALPVLVATPVASARPAPPTGCAQVEAIAVRGSTERQGGGSIAGPLADAVQTRSNQTVRRHDLVYPASLNNYSGSVRQGVSALQARLRSTSSSCPSTTFVLTGYSQGAQVIGDTLAGGSVPGAGRIRAVVLHGDPAFNGSEPYNAGSYLRGRDGIFGRSQGALSPFSSAIRSYCNRTDNFCQRGASGNGHYQYRTDRGDGTTFVLGRIGG